MKQITTILLGLGRISYGYNVKNKKNYLTHYKSIINDKRFKLLYCIEPNRKKKIKLKTKVFNNIKNASSNLKPRLAIIATPTITHFKAIKEIIKFHSSVKYILCEKPFCNNFKEALKIDSMCKKKKIKVYINYMRRAEPGVILSKKIINKKLKGFIYGNVYYDGTTLNQASHMINLLQYWLGEIITVKRINNFNKKISKFGVDFKINFKKAEIYFFGLNIKKFSYASIKLISKNGEFNYTDRGANILYKSKIKDKIFNEDYMPNEKFVKIKNDMNNYQKHVYNEIYKDIVGQKAHISMSKDALETMRILKKI